MPAYSKLNKLWYICKVKHEPIKKNEVLSINKYWTASKMKCQKNKARHTNKKSVYKLPFNYQKREYALSWRIHKMLITRVPLRRVTWELRAGGRGNWHLTIPFLSAVPLAYFASRTIKTESFLYAFFYLSCIFLNSQQMCT